MDNRRRYDRIPVSLIVMYEVNDQQEIDQEVRHDIATPVIMNLSQDGMKLIVWEALPKGLSLKIYVSTFETTEYLEIVGRVIWSAANDDNQILAGVRFVDFIDGSEKQLTEMLQECCESSIS